VNDEAIQDRSDERRGRDANARAGELAILWFEVAESIASADAAVDGPKPPRRSPPLR
jgi:hypothetical protein